MTVAVAAQVEPHLEAARTTTLIAGRHLKPTAVFDTYWRFAAARQQMYLARLHGIPRPWTHDPILSQYRFTNCYRAADRVSQHLIRDVIYRGDQDWDEVFFRTMLFKLFNRSSTWQLLTAAIGTPSWHDYRFDRYDSVLSAAMTGGQRLYSAAYVIPPPQLGEIRKHRNHLRLLEMMMAASAPARIAEAASLREVFTLLRTFPTLGNFLAYQFAIDLNYTAELAFDEMEYVVAGPGARDGIRKCFGPQAHGIETDIIRYVTDTQEEHFARLNLSFPTLGGRRLHLIDCQNLFCEVDKYARLAHPDIAGISGRTQIKQHFRQDTAPVTAWFPPKWAINDRLAAAPPNPA
ncbi:putative DNA base hypermodification protein [Actinoplanes oblitus]|uniref:DNA base hypermodification protein n=1 Tax=Actinoplanes oblitus TaxID=3040509 RepID=A0ABY8WT57_9ACTN|nr:nucleotide kinase domain-containing protein [Actinoplanes oblitus]WIM99972.1 putative DNA base hypermodification protein [Actinoplanes oblitus]